MRPQERECQDQVPGFFGLETDSLPQHLIENLVPELC